MTVMGVAASEFWRLAFRGRKRISACVWSDVQIVELRDVVKDGRKYGTLEVAVTREDSQLALRAAIASVEAIEEHGLRILDAIATQKGEHGRSVGEHDLVCERRQGPAGKTSVEVKFRRMTHASMLHEVRRQLRQEAWRLFEHANSAGHSCARAHGFAEQAYVLLCWGPGPSTAYALGDWTKSFAEVIPAHAPGNTAECWKTLWGWALAQPQARAQAKAAAKAQAAAVALAKAKAQAKQTAFKRHYAKLRQVIIKHGKDMRSVPDLLKLANTAKAKTVRPTIGERMPVWAPLSQNLCSGINAAACFALPVFIGPCGL